MLHDSAQEPDPFIDSLVTSGSDDYRGFSLDNVYHSPDDGDIHFSLHVPATYDGDVPFALFITLSGAEGWYSQGAGANLKSEDFAFAAQECVSDMLVVAPQLEDSNWSAANRVIALIEHIFETYAIDPSRVYIEGYSAGGRTVSLVLEARPTLFSAALQVSSSWDGELEPVADARLPLYLFTGESDEEYGSSSVKGAYARLVELYRAAGLADAEIEELVVLDVRNGAYFVEREAAIQHEGGKLAAYEPGVMSWLFR